jgi:hypothetical protein
MAAAALALSGCGTGATASATAGPLDPTARIRHCLPIGAWEGDADLMSTALVVTPELDPPPILFTDVIYEASSDVIDAEPVLIVGEEHMPGFALEVEEEPDGSYASHGSSFELRPLPAEYTAADELTGVGLRVTVRVDGERDPTVPLITYQAIEYEDGSGQYRLPVDQEQWISRRTIDDPAYCSTFPED